MSGVTAFVPAVGPLVLAQCVAYTGSYATAFYGLAAVVAVPGLAPTVVREPALAEMTSRLPPP